MAYYCVREIVDLVPPIKHHMTMDVGLPIKVFKNVPLLNQKVKNFRKKVYLYLSLLDVYLTHYFSMFYVNSFQYDL